MLEPCPWQWKRGPSHRTSREFPAPAVSLMLMSHQAHFPPVVSQPFCEISAIIIPEENGSDTVSALLGFYSKDVLEPGCRPQPSRFGGQVPTCELKGFQQEMMCSGQMIGRSDGHLKDYCCNPVGKGEAPYSTHRPPRWQKGL